MKPFHFFSTSGDCYEVVLRGCVISRITMYASGTQKAQETEYDNVPEEIKVKILEKVSEALDDEQ